MVSSRCLFQWFKVKYLGDISYWFPGKSLFGLQHDLLFTGDTLHVRKNGQTDLPGGDSKTLYETIHNKIFEFANATRIFPCHDYNGYLDSTIGEEKEYNLQVDLTTTLDEFVKGMRIVNPKLRKPSNYLRVMEANRNGGVEIPVQLHHQLFVSGSTILNPQSVRLMRKRCDIRTILHIAPLGDTNVYDASAVAKELGISYMRNPLSQYKGTEYLNAFADLLFDSVQKKGNNICIATNSDQSRFLSYYYLKKFGTSQNVDYASILNQIESEPLRKYLTTERINRLGGGAPSSAFSLPMFSIKHLLHPRVTAGYSSAKRNSRIRVRNGWSSGVLLLSLMFIWRIDTQSAKRL